MKHPRKTGRTHRWTTLTRRKSGLRAPRRALISAWLLLLPVIMVLMVVSIATQSVLKQNRVVVMYPTRSDAPVPRLQDPIYRKVLEQGSPEQLDYHSEFIDLLRFPQPAYQAALFELLSSKYKDQPVDLVITNWTPPPNEFATRYRPQLFPTTPVVYIYRELHEQEANSTGIYYDHDVKKTMETALTLQPDTKQVFVIVGSSQVDKNHQNRSAAQFQEFAARVQINYLTDIPMTELLNRVANLPPNSILFYQTVTGDGAGNRFITTDALDQIAAVANAPIYASDKVFLNHGIVGGGLLDNEILAAQAAKVGLRVLNGERVANIPITKVQPYVTEVDWRQLKRWGLDESRLPLGAVVSFKPPSFWEQYKWHIIGLVSAIIVEALLIVWLLYAQQRRKRAEKESKRLSELTEKAHKRLAEIVSNVPGIVWETRIDPGTNRRITTFISDYVERMLGYTSEEWLKQPPGFGLKLIPEEDRERVARESDAVIETGKEGVSEFRWLTRDGSIRWVENYLSPIVDEKEGIIGLRGVALDVTDRKLAEESARRTEEQNTAIVNAIPDFIFLIDSDGVYLDFHAKDLDDLLLPPDRFLGKNMRDVLPASLADEFFHSFERALLSPEPQIVEYKLEQHDEEKWYEARIVRMGNNYLSVVRDITRIKLAYEAVSDLSRRLMNAQEKERARIARELHDDLSQSLALFSIQLSQLSYNPTDAIDSRNQIDHLVSELSRVGAHVHRLSHELHPAKLTQLGLETALRGLCREIAAAHHLRVDFEAEKLPVKLPDDISLCLYRVAQEALQNVVKHSCATSVRVRIRMQNGEVRMTITDDGIGFETNGAKVKESLGLISINERVRAVKGSIRIESELGAGTKIEAIIPVNRQV